MSNREKSSRLINFGEVIRVEETDPHTGEVCYSGPGVVVDVQGASMGVADIVEINDRTYLTSFGTTYGTPRPIEGARPWTPLEIATAVADGIFEKTPEGEIVESQRPEYKLVVNSLLRSLTERQKQSPWHYPLS